MKDQSERRIGLVMVGLGGAVASTVAASIYLLKEGLVGTEGLPLASKDLREAAQYENICVAGWDVSKENIYQSAKTHNVIEDNKLEKVKRQLTELTPWPAFHNEKYCRGLKNDNLVKTNSYKSIIGKMKGDLRSFKTRQDLDSIVVVNLVSTEIIPDLSAPCFRSLKDFQVALEQNDENISASMMYAYATIDAGFPYANFTPSYAADIKPLLELAELKKVPLAGKDGKTGQTLLKTAIAPVLRDRGLIVEGWYSTNLLGNLDGLVLKDEKSKESKINTKKSVLNNILGYEVENHHINIIYQPPKGDRKEAWDSIDLLGFLGEKMQMKINFLCADSILAAPLVIEIARLLDLASQKKMAGELRELSVFFKSPVGYELGAAVHDFDRQQLLLTNWLNNL